MNTHTFDLRRFRHLFHNEIFYQHFVDQFRRQTYGAEQVSITADREPVCDVVSRAVEVTNHPVRVEKYVTTEPNKNGDVFDSKKWEVTYFNRDKTQPPLKILHESRNHHTWSEIISKEVSTFNSEEDGSREKTGGLKFGVPK